MSKKNDIMLYIYVESDLKDPLCRLISSKNGINMIKAIGNLNENGSQFISEMTEFIT